MAKKIEIDPLFITATFFKPQNVPLPNNKKNQSVNSSSLMIKMEPSRKFYGLSS